MKMTDFVRKPFGLGAKNNVLRVLRKIESFVMKILYPNITGGFGQVKDYTDDEQYGAFSGSAIGIGGVTHGSSGGKIVFDASTYSEIYGKSETIQPQSIRVFCIVRI